MMFKFNLFVLLFDWKKVLFVYWELFIYCPHYFPYWWIGNLEKFQRFIEALLDQYSHLSLSLKQKIALKLFVLNPRYESPEITFNLKKIIDEFNIRVPNSYLKLFYNPHISEQRTKGPEVLDYIDHILQYLNHAVSLFFVVSFYLFTFLSLEDL